MEKTRLERKPRSEAVVSDWISMVDGLELAARMEGNAQIREDHAEAMFWEKQDSKELEIHHPFEFVTADYFYVCQEHYQEG